MWPCITCLPIEPPSGAVCGGWWHRARRCRHIEQMETVTAMERFRAIAGERGMVLGELLEHALGAFVREQDWRAEAR
jgi:hypothetical protein